LTYAARQGPGIKASAQEPKKDVVTQAMVFVGGIHGVGKTTISRALAALLPAAHVTAGSLIRETASPAHRVTVGIGDKADERLRPRMRS
jgi:Mg-chelatase subunit ChlI